MADETSKTGDNGDPTEDEGADAAPGDQGERRWKRGIALTLAGFAVLGAWIAVIQTNAATNESHATREVTRLAAEAETATVVEVGVAAALDQIEAEIATLDSRGVFLPQEAARAEFGIEPDPDREAQRLAAAEESVTSALGSDGSGFFQLQLDARELTLAQATLVDVRVTWNARASQYETVIAVLAVALFLVGLTAVVARGLRPPLALPGLLLALFCFGWTIHIYSKPIPNVSEEAISATAEGQAYLDNGQVADAFDAFDRAIEAHDSYLPAHEGRAMASLMVANPDVVETLAFTGTDPDAHSETLEALDRALELGGHEDVATLALSGFAAIGAGDYDTAAESLEAAIALNPLTPTLQFALSAVEVARGDEEAAVEWRSRAVDQLGPVDESDRNREVAAVYYTVLEKVADDVPEQRELAERIRDETVAAEAALTIDRPLTGETFPDAQMEIREVSFDDGESVIDIGMTGLPADAIVTVVGYELPSPGSSFVQPRELFYTGPPPSVPGSRPIRTPRACHPVEYRFDLYVEGVLVETQTVPGGAATC